jgi:hypothetical protein
MIDAKRKRKLQFIPILTLLIAITAAFVWWELRCPEEIIVSIGEFDSKDAGLRASIPRLAAEVHRCPEAEMYRIIWVAPETDPNHSGINRRSTFYSRATKTIGYEADVHSGSVGRTYVVDDATINAVAEKGGTLEDFQEYEKSVR